METVMEMYGGKVYGVKVSDYGLQHGYLDYRALAELVGDMILNNSIYDSTYSEEWELVSGTDCIGIDEEGYECDAYSDECIDVIHYDVYQFYIISEKGYEFLRDHTDQMVYYNNELDLYLWGITHYGTSWDYVLTDIKLKEML